MTDTTTTHDADQPADGLPPGVQPGAPVSLTGHRPGRRAGGGYGRYDDGAWVWVRHELPRVLDRLAPCMLWSGGALGFDQLGGFLAVEHGVPLGLALPFEGFDARWPDASRRQLQWLQARATEVVTVCEPGYAAWKLHARNDYLLERATTVVALWDGEQGGGTASAVAKALDGGLPVVHLDPHRRVVRLLQRTVAPVQPDLLVPPDDGATPPG